MPVQNLEKKLQGTQTVLYKKYSGSVTIEDMIASLVLNVVKTVNKQANYILSDWQEVTAVEFNKEDVLSAVEGALSVDFISEEMFIAFVYNSNPHFDQLAENFITLLAGSKIHAQTFSSEDEAIDWLKACHNKQQ